MPDYKTTKKDFVVFKVEWERWLNYWGLFDWEVCFLHEEVEGCRASCLPDYEGRLAMVTLNKTWSFSPEKNELKLMAFHEVTELFLAPLSLAAMERYISRKEIISAIHGIIRTLENTVFKGKKL